jgi:hypothetical protein
MMEGSDAIHPLLSHMVDVKRHSFRVWIFSLWNRLKRLL